MDRKKIVSVILTVLAGALGLWLTVAVVFPLGAPFLVSFLLALLTEPLVLWLLKKGFPRWLAATLCTLGVYLSLFGGVFFLGRWLLREAGAFLTTLPDLLQRMSGPLSRLEETLLDLADKLPDGIGVAANQVLSEFFSNGAGLLEGLPEKILTFLTGLARKVPSLLFFSITTVIASFMTAAALPSLRLWLTRILPSPWRKKVTTLWRRLKTTTGSWFRAQGKLFLITFAIVTGGLFLLRAPYPLLGGLATAVVDALPILGSGTVLIPWAFLLFLRGQTIRGVAFLLLYAITALTRVCLEPRLVGKQMGIPPLLTLVAIYVGFRLCGVGGMILFPFAAALTVQFLHLSKRDA